MDADELLKRFDRLKGDRTNWESHWEEVAQRVMPDYSTTFTSPSPGATKGNKRNLEVYDSTAISANIRFAAAMESMLTPRNQTWHRIRPSDRTLRANKQVKLWFEEVNQRMWDFRYSPRANFASQIHECYLGLGAFGTASMFIDALADPTDTRVKGLRYRANHLAEVFFLENHQGIVDTVFRRFTMTARQMAQKWGFDALPDKIKADAKDKPENEFEVVHCVMPRGEVDPRRKDFRGMRFASYYLSVEGRKQLSEGGYHTFPYAIGRYVVAPGEVYGRSPAMLALPAIKTLNEEKKAILKQGHRTVDPVLLAHDDGVLDTFSLRPGAINAGGVTADGRPLVHALPVGNLAVGKDMMDDERMQINDIFLVTLFQILVETPQMTATEVLERAREKGALLSPTMGRQQSEFLGPTLERELDVLAQQGLIPPMPRILAEAQGEYTIEYDSPLSRAQRAEEAAGLMRTVQWASEIASVTQNPEPLDHFDWDKIVPELSDISAVPARWMRDQNVVEAIRKGRTDGAAAQNLVNALPGAAAMTKALAVAGGK
mgnify:CR=1 FL=1